MRADREEADPLALYKRAERAEDKQPGFELEK